MIIITQKRKCATTDLNLEIRPSGEKWILENEYFYLGWYSTEEKAIKVLEMICRAYEDFHGGNVYEHSIFQMPQDSEV